MANVATSEIIELIRGLIKDILVSGGQNSFQYDSDATFKLSSDRISSDTIVVYVNETDITSDNWTYAPSTKRLTITSSLTSGDDILVTFSYYEKYSDTELIKYIKANLTRFTQKNYKKRFYVNSSDEIVTDNGENPTRAEGDIIALVTAIDIDPQNININTRDFTISATENKSKSEQINIVLSNFLRCPGVLRFLEEED